MFFSVMSLMVIPAERGLKSSNRSDIVLWLTEYPERWCGLVYFQLRTYISTHPYCALYTGRGNTRILSLKYAVEMGAHYQLLVGVRKAALAFLGMKIVGILETCWASSNNELHMRRSSLNIVIQHVLSSSRLQIF